jgi:uncharacterized protein (DUF1697 family)
MTTLVSMLRGVNVTGHNMIRMAELKALYESRGFRNVTTYIQSGNVVFQAEKDDPAAVETIIERAIKNKFGLPVSVVVRLPSELSKVIKKSPFHGGTPIDKSRLYITFLKSKPAPDLVKALQPAAAKSDDQYKILGNEIHLYCPNGYGKTLLSNSFFEKQLKGIATTRNWKTVNALQSIALSIKE